MSPRAAWRLEGLGFQRVYDFMGGKLDWLSRGLPTEGAGPAHLVAGQVVRAPTATCRPGTPAGWVRAELEPGWDPICTVTNEEGIVVGRVRWKDLPADDDVPIGDVMQIGPATVRPREELKPLVKRMNDARVKSIIVTTAKGELVGIVHRDDAQRLIQERG